MISFIEMSLTASLLTIVIIIIRSFFIHKLPKRVFPILWFIVVIRLLLPFSIPILPNTLPLTHTTKEALEHKTEPTVSSEITQNTNYAASTTSPKTNEKKQLTVVPNVIIILWGIGFLILSTYFVTLHFHFRKKYKTALPANIEFNSYPMKRNVKIKVSDQVSTPLTYGILKPVILLPKTLDFSNEHQLNFIISHEAVHIKYYDVLYKWFLTIALCLHWFNPVIWIMYAFSNRDIELACDEEVIRMLKAEPSSYALALISLEEKRCISPMLYSFSKNNVKERIEAIMKFSKKSISSIVAASVIIIGATAIFTTAQADKKSDKSNGKVPESTMEVHSNIDVIQYLCTPEYFTVEEYEKSMEEEKKAIEQEVIAGTLDSDAKREMLKVMDAQLEKVRKGEKVEAPVPVYYSDHSPVLNSNGEQLYCKSSEVERLNEELRTFNSLDSEAFAYGSDISWYTYEDYKTYVDTEKESYQNMLGEWGFTLSKGWFEWTTEEIDQATQLLEANLAFIKSGGKISKPNSDDDDTGFSVEYAPDQEMTINDETTFVIPDFSQTELTDMSSISNEDIAVIPSTNEENTTYAVSSSEIDQWDYLMLSDYFDFGVSPDMKKKYFLIDGKPIAGLFDEGYFTLADNDAQKNNGVYVHVIRKKGNIKRLEIVSPNEFSKLSGLTITM